MAGGVMSASPSRRQSELLPLDRLVGRAVVDRDGRSAGRIQECQFDVRGREWVITAYVLGVGGLLERLNVGVKLVIGARIRGMLAPAPQMDISDPEHPRLTCRREELREA
jgi:hypothetical protein